MHDKEHWEETVGQKGDHRQADREATKASEEDMEKLDPETPGQSTDSQT